MQDVLELFGRPKARPASRDLDTILQDIFHLSHFRNGQREIISTVLSQKDVIAVLPTGGGKSLCYQMIAVATEQLVIVISPLIALMKDQVEGLKRLGIPGASFHTGQSYGERRTTFEEIKKGGAYVLYLSPERASADGFKTWIEKQSIALFAVDEAHCVSQWGHDFRKEYSELHMLKAIRPDVPVLALTASATPTVIRDISKQLSLHAPAQMVFGFYRPNLYYQVEACADEEEKVRYLLQACSQYPDGRILVYCGTRKMTETLAKLLKKTWDRVGFYHAGMTSEDRTEVQQAYMAGSLRILTATNAFGMGVDQPDVRLVVHFQMPANIDSLYQEMGRAGRDGNPSTCLMLYSKKDKGLQTFFIQSSNAPQPIKRLRYENLNALINYAEGGECRHAEILTYFKDTQRIKTCGHCDICLVKTDRKIARPAIQIKTLLKKQTQKKQDVSRKSSDTLELSPDQENRFQRLREWRKKKAAELDLPAFIIFSDRTLRNLAATNPQTIQSLQTIHGMGTTKIAQFGDEVISVLNR